jgi:hypothetical protein
MGQLKILKVFLGYFVKGVISLKNIHRGGIQHRPIYEFCLTAQYIVTFYI